MKDWKEHRQCLICNSSRLKYLDDYKKDFLCKCKDCGFVFAGRVPTQEELIAHYEGYGRNDYLSPVTIKRYHEILDLFEPVRKTNRLLDIGCGIGYFLEEAKKRGWEVYGTEYTDKAMEICSSKGIQMHSGMLNPANYEPEGFDVITSFEVIEHIDNPLEETANIGRILRKGGYFYVTTPNFNSLLRYYLKGEYNIIDWPEHLSYYTPSTLNKLMQTNGFKKIFIQTTGFSLTRLKTSRGKQDSAEPAFIAEDTQDEKMRRRFEENPLLGFVKKTINGLLTIIGKGDALKGLFVKS